MTLFGISHIHVCKNIHNISQDLLIQIWISIIHWKNTFKSLVLALNGSHGIINYFSDFRRVSRRGNSLPSCFFRNKEDIVHHVCITIVLKAITFSYQFFISSLKSCRNIAKENQTDNNLPILCCRNVSPKDTRCIPDLFLKPDVCLCFFSHCQ